MNYIREQDDSLTRSPGGYHRADSFIKFNVFGLESSRGTVKEWIVQGTRTSGDAYVYFARFEKHQKAEAQEALDELIATILDPSGDCIIAPWPLRFDDSASEPPKSA